MARFRGLIGKTKGKFVSEKRWLREREIIEKRILAAGKKMREAIRARDSARSVKVKKRWQKVIDRERPKQQRELQARASMEKQGARLVQGKRLEVTLRMRRTVPRGDPAARKNRLKMLKVSVEITKKGVTKAQVERAVEDAIRSNRRTPGIKLQFADWEAARDGFKGVERSQGRLGLEGEGARQLQAFRGLLRRNAIASSEVRDVSESSKSRSGAKGAKRRRAD